MLLLSTQQNAGWGYKSIVTALETLLKVKTNHVGLQKLFLETKNIIYNAFNFTG